MATIGLVGLPGHGKSYSAVECFIVPALNEGRTIYTNIPLHMEPILAKWPNADIRQYDIVEACNEPGGFGASLENGFLAIFDELWRLWPSGLKTADIPKDQLSFIKEHRHKIGPDGREPDIVLVTQDLADIASSIRQMIETTIICSKLLTLGAKNTFRRDYYRGAVKGQNGPKASFARSDHGCKYKAEIYQLYKSHTKGDTNASVNNSGTVNISIFKSTGFLVGAGVLGLLVVGIVYGVNRTSSKLDTTVNKLKKDAPVTSAPYPGAVPAPAPVIPKFSETYRLVGQVAMPGKLIYMISDGRQTIKLGSSECKKELNSSFIRCLFQGELITSFSGPREIEPNVTEPETLAVAAFNQK